MNFTRWTSNRLHAISGWRHAAAIALLVLTTGTVAAQQPQIPQQPPVFRGNVDAIEMDAFVTDRAGNAITDLTIDDFEILEDGQLQEITSFALVNIPIEKLERPLFAPRPIEPDVRTNERPEGRVYVIAIDEFAPPLLARTRLYLRRFIERYVAANDTAAIVYLGRGNSKETQDFTSDRQLLLKAVDRVTGGFGSMPAPAETIAPGSQSNPANAEAEFLLRSKMRALRDLTEFLGSMHGRRKSILFLTDGLGASVYEALDYNGGVRSVAIEDFHGAITAATRGNVSIYPINPAGITPAGDIADEAAPQSDNGAANASTTSLGRTQDLRALAEATGGFAIINTNSFDEGFTRLVSENSTYYVLGFSTTSTRNDGRFHRVDVRVKRAGLQVRSRGGYLSPLRTPRPKPATGGSTLEPAIVEALRSPIPVAGVPLRVFAAPFKGTDAKASVAIAIEVGVEGLQLARQNDRLVGDIAVALRPISAGGKLLPGQRHEAKLTLKPDTFERARLRGVRVLTEMPLEAGRYQLRVGGGNNDGRAGSVTYDLEIPNFTKDPLVMSGVAVTSNEAQNDLTITPAAKPLVDVLPSPLTATREFKNGETITLYTEVYENGRRAGHTVDFKVELRADDGRVLSQYTDQRSSTELGGARGGYGFIPSIPLIDVSPGIYVLHVEARANIGAQPVVSKDVQIKVRGEK